ncbi:MAG: DUF4398 domain-containing protein [bacterium]|nr:DUF4398 domain-containing protein [bacterium]
MKIINYAFLTALLVLTLSFGQEIGAQDTAAANTETELQELRTVILTKIGLVKDLLKQADDNYNAGEYDKGYDYAIQAKQITDEINKLREELYFKVQANNKIEQAKTMIGQAESMEADKWAPDELANAKTSLLSAQNSFEQKSFSQAVTYADEAINYAQSCLNKIDEHKKALEAEQLKKLTEHPDVKQGRNLLDESGEFKIKTSYTVRYIPERRDCLWRIAEYDYIYNNPWKWPVIYKANKNRIKDPDLIYPGQKFSIPELDDKGNPILLEKEKVRIQEIKEIKEQTSGKEDSEKQTPVNQKQEKNPQE